MTNDERGAVSILSQEPGARRRETGADMLVVVVALLAFVAPLSAGPVSTTLLYQTPTADVLPAGALAIAADVTYPLIQTPKNVNYLETDVNVRFSPYRGLDFALTAYTFADYAFDVKFQAAGGGPDRCGLALGIYDIGLSSYVSPVGHDTANAWPDWKYNQYLPRYNRQTERFSAFVVTSIPVTRFARLHLGLGRGRFVGYDVRSKYFNIDYLFDEYHQWAFGLFGGVEVLVTAQVTLVAEASGRDMNTGVKVNYDAFTAMVAWTKMEGLLFDEGEKRFGRLEVGLSYQFDNLSGRSAVTRPRGHYAPLTEPWLPHLEAAEASSPVPSESEVKLLPIYFGLDKSTIWPWFDDVLKRNAEAIFARAKAGLKADVIIEGHTCPTASEAHNVDLGMRRAQAAKAYLIGLGVDAALLTTESVGSAHLPYRDKAEYYLDRRCEFRWRY
jgi:outer membrane protein OmpA-like peptidoglycan-associated protein